MNNSKSISPQETWTLERQQKSIGNATDLTSWMITVANDPMISNDIKNIAFTNWNLDSDRGYAYKTWKGRIPNVDNSTVGNEEYVQSIGLSQPNFLPSRSGFHFDNDSWPSIPLTEIDVGGVKVPIGDASNGLCGWYGICSS